MYDHRLNVACEAVKLTMPLYRFMRVMARANPADVGRNAGFRCRWMTGRKMSHFGWRKENREMKWVDRVFDSNVPINLYPELIERLRGTPARIEELTESLPAKLLVQREGDKWSIQEHVGHLIDVEDLFLGRLDDYEAGKQTLRPAEISGRKTYEANHNDGEIASILIRFRRVRGEYVHRLEGWDATVFRRTALHPRLNRQMVVTDMLHFQAEHDDHHLARVTELTRLFRKGHQNYKD